MKAEHALQQMSDSLDSGAARIVNDAVILPRNALIAAVVSAQGGDEKAKNAVVNSTSRLVFNIAKAQFMKWLPKLPHEAQFDDVFLGGCEGLVHAIRRFDASRGFSFTTLATYEVNNKVQRSIYPQLGAVKIPEYRIRDMDPADPQYAINQSRLDQPIAGDTEMTHADLLVDRDDHHGADVGVDLADLLEVLRRVDERLPEIGVIVAQGGNMQLAADQFGISRERVRQLLMKCQQVLADAGYGPVVTD